MQTGLWYHPAYPSSAIPGEIGVSVERLSATALRFHYLILGRIDDLVLPPPASSLRADNLWRTTCFEAFLAPSDGPGYRELNFSPSSQWAAYDFSAYRSGRVDASLPGPPDIKTVRRADRFETTVTISLDLGHEPYRLGLAAVIEERGGHTSFWSVRHPSDAPDFHHADCFALELPPVGAP